MPTLSKTATAAPFSPSEVRGAIDVPLSLPSWRKLLRFAGPGLLISVGYMDPGNWATDIEAGSHYGYGLLFVVVLSSFAAMFFQILCARLGVAADRDLARLCRDNYSVAVSRCLWLLAELAIVACDVSEVLGAALAFNLLFGLPLWIGVLITGLDTLLVLGLRGRGFRQLEAIVLGLVGTIGIGFVIEMFLLPPHLREVARGLLPSLDVLRDPDTLYLTVGILGATVMPHNLYLHTSIVQTRTVSQSRGAKYEAAMLATIDIVISLFLAMLINAAILIVAASAFYGRADSPSGIGDAYRLLQPIAGPAAALVFGLALLASGQSSTLTGTIAGQVIMEGFLDVKVPGWQRRLITRVLALLPALGGILWFGAASLERLIVLSQVVLSLQLPFALYPLIRFCGSRRIMGNLANGALLTTGAWVLFGVITAANLWLIRGLLF